MNEDNGLSPRKLIRLTIVGDHRIGKTSILNSLVNINNNNINITSTTSAELFVKLYNINDVIYRVQIWDTMGHLSLLPLNKQYYQNIECLIIVFDVSNRQSFENVNQWYNRFLDYYKVYSKNNMPLLILLGNIRENKFREISINEATLFAKSLNMLYFELSAINITYVNATFQKITNAIVKHLFEPETPSFMLESCCTSPREKLLKNTKTPKSRSCFTQCFFP